MNWIKNDITKGRPASEGGLQERRRHLGDSVTDEPVGGDVWHHWDFQLYDGDYVLEWVSHGAVWWNFIVVGAIPAPNVPIPVHPKDRFGVVTSIDSKSPLRRTSVKFNAREDMWIRIESWTQRPGRENKQPLPRGFDRWVTLGRIFGGLIILVERKNFGRDHHSVMKRTDGANDILFAAEDGGDHDFNDLVVRLRPA